MLKKSLMYLLVASTMLVATPATRARPHAASFDGNPGDPCTTLTGLTGVIIWGLGGPECVAM